MQDMPTFATTSFVKKIRRRFLCSLTSVASAILEVHQTKAKGHLQPSFDVSSRGFSYGKEVLSGRSNFIGKYLPCTLALHSRKYLFK